MITAGSLLVPKDIAIEILGFLEPLDLMKFRLLNKFSATFSKDKDVIFSLIKQNLSKHYSFTILKPRPYHDDNFYKALIIIAERRTDYYQLAFTILSFWEDYINQNVYESEDIILLKSVLILQLMESCWNEEQASIYTHSEENLHKLVAKYAKILKNNSDPIYGHNYIRLFGIYLAILLRQNLPPSFKHTDKIKVLLPKFKELLLCNAKQNLKCSDHDLNSFATTFFYAQRDQALVSLFSNSCLLDLFNFAAKKLITTNKIFAPSELLFMYLLYENNPKIDFVSNQESLCKIVNYFSLNQLFVSNQLEVKLSKLSFIVNKLNVQIPSFCSFAQIEKLINHNLATGYHLNIDSFIKDIEHLQHSYYVKRLAVLFAKYSSFYEKDKFTLETWAGLAKGSDPAWEKFMNIMKRKKRDKHRGHEHALVKNITHPAFELMSIQDFQEIPRSSLLHLFEVSHDKFQDLYQVLKSNYSHKFSFTVEEIKSAEVFKNYFITAEKATNSEKAEEQNISSVNIERTFKRKFEELELEYQDLSKQEKSLTKRIKQYEKKIQQYVEREQTHQELNDETSTRKIP